MQISNLPPPEYHSKLVSLCPSFAINYLSPCGTALLGFFNLLKSHPPKPKTFLGEHKRLLDRLPYSSYVNNTPSSDKYIFFCSTLWYSNEWNNNDSEVNLRRANFIRACKSISSADFEGGFVSQGSDRSSEELFRDCLCQKHYRLGEWIEKTKKSTLVFNTPAFWNCHGWKLGEYLALGKCIVSTQLSNDLPEPLIHGKNIHFVENTQESMREAMEYILSHPEYKQKLEKGAREYWETWGTPEKSLEILFSK